jgi:arylsulfatase A
MYDTYHRLSPRILLLALACAAPAGPALGREEKAAPHPQPLSPKGRGEKEGPPNFVLVYADDLGYGDLGCYGAKKIRTPNLDRMAREGVRFTDFYVAQAVCSASRAALLTGCYPNRVGILGALGPMARHGISDKEQTIAEVLKPKGYATAIFGKWHLGHHPPFLPTRHGFDVYFGLPYSNDMLPRPSNPKYPALPLIDGDKTIATNPDQDQLTTQYTEHAVRFIADNKDRPFFLYVPHTMPHVPLHVSDKFRGKSEQGLYGDVIEEVDWSVGQILAALKEHGVAERTLVIFASDNGPWLSYGNHGGSAGPLREGKATSWEGGVREPCLMRWPGRIPAGHVCHEPAMTIDILPTLAQLAGAALPKLPIDGKDIWPLIAAKPGARSPQEAYYFYWDRELQAVRSGPWKLHFPHAYRTLGDRPGGRDGKPAEYKQARTGLALFDLEKDPGETTDLADRHPDVVERLKKLADKAREDLGDSATKQQGKGVRPAGQL